MRSLFLMLAAVIASTLALSGVTDANPSQLGSPLSTSEFVVAMTAGPDGNVWFSARQFGVDGSGWEIGDVTPSGVVVQYQSPAGARSIATGSDGKVWFTETNGIGRIAPGGEVESFELAEGSGRPRALTAGPDGNVWFVTGSPDAVEEISPYGSVTTFPLPAGGRPSAITTGPAGDLWFAEPKDARIGRVTVTGEVREFQLARGTRPSSIVLGADGNLWFGDLSQARVGRITPSGEVTFFPVPTIEGTDEVTTGPGGLIWFTAGNEIGTISIAGKVTWPSCFTPECQYPPAAVTRAPDGSPWAATDVGHCPGYCGGFSEQSYLLLGHSRIGPFTLPSVDLGIGPSLTPLRHGRTRITIGCGDHHACNGTLRLRALVKLPDGEFAAEPISRVPYSLAAGEIREVSLPLTLPQWHQLHFNRHFLIVTARQGDSRVAKRGFEFFPANGGRANHF